MSEVILGLGSNLGDRFENLNSALKSLSGLSTSQLKVSFLYETPALLKENSPETWDLPYLNLCVQLNFEGSPDQLLLKTQEIEKNLGRTRSQVWGPRILDIDIIWFEGVTREAEKLCLPHKESLKRAFVLDPLKDLKPSLKLKENSETVLELSRKHPQHSPVFMAILNVTPDSFSDGGDFEKLEAIEDYLDSVDKSVGLLDIGAESTRPGAQSLGWKEEWTRLEPVLKLLKDRYQDKYLKPQLSVDTRHGEVAARALEYGVDILNDVSGLSCPVFKELLPKTSCDYVLMHSLSIPADKNIVLPLGSLPSVEVYDWMNAKLLDLEEAGVSRDRVIIDPGIGFGKTSSQSLELLSQFRHFWDLQTRVLIGHSRKSFLDKMNSSKYFKDRDFESVGLSIKLGLEGADFLRVHNPLAHIRAWKAVSFVQNKQLN